MGKRGGNVFYISSSFLPIFFLCYSYTLLLIVYILDSACFLIQQVNSHGHR